MCLESECQSLNIVFVSSSDMNYVLHLLEKCTCFVIHAANIPGDQKCGPIRNKVCCLGGVSIPPLFKGSSQCSPTLLLECRKNETKREKINDFCVSATRSQQLGVKLEPRGVLYVKLSLQEKWVTQVDKGPACLLPV